MNSENNTPPQQVEEEELLDPSLLEKSNVEQAAPAEATTATEVEAEEQASILPKGPNANTHLDSDPSAPLKNERQKVQIPGGALNLLNARLDDLISILEAHPSLRPEESKAGTIWRNTIADSRRHAPRDDQGKNALDEEDSNWAQVVRVQQDDRTSAPIAAGSPKFGEGAGATLEGAAAMAYLQNMLGTGQVTRFPLWHSGLWLTLKAPSEDALLELDSRIAQEKISLGRMTQGLAFSNTQVYMSSHLVNFALDHVIDCSIKDYTPSELKKRILVTDLPLIMLYLLTTIYPSGYRYSRPCLHNPGKCHHVVEEVLNLTRLNWTKTNVLTQSQRALMVRKTAKFTDLELENYRNNHSYLSKRTAVLKTVERDSGAVTTSVELKVPTLAEYEASGFAWIEGIVTATQDAFGTQMDENERDNYIMAQARVTSLRQYAHWIERITFSDDRVIEDRKTLETTIATLTGDLEVSKNFIDAVRNFIDSATISTVAIPYYTCPECGEPGERIEGGANPHLIPLNVESIFFTLLAHRLEGLMSRPI